jgi:hypothetical protein
MMNLAIFGVLLSLNVFGQISKPTLQEVSAKVNRSLPEVYDAVTKLVTTTVENNNFSYHFLVDANQDEFNKALPKVKNQILSTLCTKNIERSILKDHNANIVYRYENVKGQSLGEFMVKPDHCPKK